MMVMIRRRDAVVLRGLALLLVVAAGPISCGLLDADDPTAVEDGDLNDASGALLLRGAAVRQLATGTTRGALFGGLLADELRCCGDPVYADDWFNRRAGTQYEAATSADGGNTYQAWQELRVAASVALPKLRDHAGLGAEPYVGEMYALRGFAALRLAEDFCPGFPLHDVVDYAPSYGPPLSTEAAFAKALADLDSAVTHAGDSARILHLARAGQARTLLELGRFAEAATAAAGVPTDYHQDTQQDFGNELAIGGGYFFLDQFGIDFYSVADMEGGNGLDFVSAADPRVVTTPLETLPNGVVRYGIAKYPAPDASPIVLVSGIEARLIEAEAALHGGGDWLGILNALRTTCADAATCPDPAPAGSGGVAGLPPLTDPGTEAGQVDLVFRERAFWLFATGTRLGDLRRLIRLYGRSSESVFPTGPAPGGGAYGTATSVPFPAALEAPANPTITGCTSQ